ncbi:hypothetical protein PAMP_013317 [Pampus punctatissimus]
MRTPVTAEDAWSRTKREQPPGSGVRRSSSPPLSFSSPPLLHPTDHGPGDSAALSHPQCSILSQHDQQQCGGGLWK